MVDIKYIQKQLKHKKEHEDRVNYNLFMRSMGKPASQQYGWATPLEADGVPVWARKNPRSGTPNIKVSTEIFNDIITTKASYGFSDIQREFADDIDDTVKDLYKEYDRMSHTDTLMNDLAEDDAMCGISYTLTFLHGEGKDRKPMTKRYPAWNGYVKYDDMTGLPVLGCIYGCVGKKDNRYTTGESETYFIEVYDNTMRYRYEGKSETDNFELKSEEPHGFKEVPVVEWLNNKKRVGNAELALSAIDALDSLMSDGASEIATLANAYLVLINAGSVNEEMKKQFRDTGILPMQENAKAEFITKDINPEFISLVKEELRKIAYEASQSLDPRVLAGKTELRKTQADNLFAPLDKSCKATERNWQKSLELLDRVLKSFWTGLAIPSVADYDTYDIDYKFNYNKPSDILTELKEIKEAGGVLPQYKIFMLSLGLNEDAARALAEESKNEQTEMLPDFN